MAGNAARAYSYAQPLPQRRTQVRVVPGQAPAQSISPAIVSLARVFMVVVAVVAVLACVRIALTAATVGEMISEQEISAQIDTVRADNASLEVRRSLLSSPSYVKDQATKLGMAEIPATDTIALGPDVVAFDDAGMLSLSASLRNAS